MKICRIFLFVYFLMPQDILLGQEESQSYENSIILTTVPVTPGSVKDRHIILIPGTPYDLARNLSYYSPHGYFTKTGQYSAKLHGCKVDYSRKVMYMYDESVTRIEAIPNFDWSNQFQSVTAIYWMHRGVSVGYVKMAIDWVSHNIYWTDPLFRWIGMQPADPYSVDESLYRIIIKEDLEKPYGLAVDPIDGFLFWTEISKYPKIERASLTGENREVIVSSGLLFPICVDVDVTGSDRRIYWADAGRDTVETTTLSGADRRIIRRIPHTEFYDMALFRDILSVVDVNRNKVFFINKQDGHDATNPYTRQNETIWGICMYDDETQPQLTDYCISAPCSDICVNVKGNATCLCREGYKLGSDGHNCTEDTSKYHRALVLANSHAIYLADIRCLAAGFSAYPQKQIYNTIETIKFLSVDTVGRKIFFASDHILYFLEIDVTSPQAYSPVIPASIITGLSFDWIHNEVYWATLTGDIWMNSLDGKSAASVTLLRGLDRPRGLKILALTEQMVWISGENDSQKIEISKLNGTQRKILVPSAQLSNPKSLKFESNTNKLYWVDGGSIKRVNIDGSSLEILSVSAVAPNLFSVYKDYLVWSEDGPSASTIISANARNPQQSINFTGVGIVVAMDVLDETLQPSHKGPCQADNGNCEHICIPDGNVGICKCEYGFKIDSNGRTCSSEPLNDNFLLVSDWTHNKLYQVSLVNDSDVRAVDVDSAGNPNAVLYDPVNSRVIWGDTRDQRIRSANLDGSYNKMLVYSGWKGSFVDRLAIDMSGNLYYTSASLSQDGSGFKGVSVISPKGDNRDLVSEGYVPRDIVLDPSEGLMFWTDHGTVPTVKRANMDGTAITMIISVNITWPNGIAIDYQAKMLYVTDGYYNTIQRCTYSGNCTTIHTDPGAQLMDIEFSGQYLYYTAWNRPSITRMNKDNPRDITQLATNAELGRLDSISIYNSSAVDQPENDNCFPNKGLGDCSTLCLPTSSGRTCTCEDGVSLWPGSTICQDIPKCSSSIANGQITGSCSYLTLSNCSYSCNTFYRPSTDDNIISCTNGQWDIQRPCVFFAGPDHTVLTPNLTTYSAAEGSSLSGVTCTCSACLPDCTVEWSFNGTVISHNSTVEISKVGRFSTGRYTCACVSPATLHTTTAFFDLNVKYGPDNVTVLPKNASYTLEEGKRIPDINCNCGICNPSCFAEWFYKNNSMGKSSTLQLGQINRNDSGEHTCLCKNPWTMKEITTAVLIHVEYGPDKVTLSPEQTSYTLAEDSFILDINCICGMCNPLCSAQWFFNGINMGSSSILQLGHVNRNSSGEYSCRCTNPNTMITKSSAVSINVMYGPDKVAVSPQNTSYSLVEGSLVADIDCICGPCNPSCNAQWNFSDSRIGNNSTLQLGHINRNASGEYFCSCTNPGSMENKSTSVELNVEYGPDKVAVSPQNTSYSLVEGSLVPDIECICGPCNPSCNAQWDYSENRMKNNDTLQLGYINRKESGEYVCRCTNPRTMEIKSMSVELYVQYGPDRVTVSPQNTSYSLIEGSLMPDIECICRTCNPSCNAQWDYNGDRIGNNDILQLGHVNRNSSGGYVCQCTNPATMEIKLTSVELTVKYGPDNIVLRPDNATYTRTIGSYLGRIDCQCVECAPHCEVTWSKSGKVIVNGGVLELDRLSSQHTGQYVCRCSNPTTQTEKLKAFQLTVNALPDIHPCPENIDELGTDWNETLAGDTVSIDCPDEGYTGNISRRCSEAGTWESSVYDCIRTSISKIEKKLEAMLNNVSQAELSPVLDELVNVTNKTENKAGSLYPGDLESVTKALNVVAQIADSGKPPTEEQSRSFVSTASNLLNKENKNSWKSLSNSKADSGASNLLQSVDVMSGAVAKGLLNNTNTSTVTIVQENIVMEASKVSDDQSSITFPASSSIQESRSSSEAKLSLPVPRGADSNLKSYTVVLYDYQSLEGILPNTVDTGQNNATEENMELGTAVLSLQVFPEQGQLQEPLVITFEKQKVNYRNDVCTYWNFQRNQWETNGSRLRSAEGSSLECEYDHLTNFAVLMSPWQEPSVDTDALEIISIVGCSISIICLVATTVLHIVLWRNVKNDRAVILLNINVALIVTYIIFLAGIDKTSNEATCKAIAAFLHYMLLVVFCLMLTEGIEITITVKYVFQTKSRIKWMLPLAWGVPAVIVGLSLGISRLKGYGTEHICWLSVETGIIWAFVGPAILIITANLVFLGILLRTMLKTKAYAEMSEMDRIKSSARCLCVLVPLMGCTWVLGILYVNEGSQWIQYMFALCNSLQGFFIFLFHGLLNKQVQTAIKGRYKKFSASHSMSKGSHSMSKGSHSVSKSSSTRRTEVTGVMNPAYLSTFIQDADSECTDQTDEKKESASTEEKPAQSINFSRIKSWNFLRKFRMSRTDITGVLNPAYMATEIPECTEQTEKKMSFSSDEPIQGNSRQLFNFGRKRSWAFKQCGSFSPMQGPE